MIERFKGKEGKRRLVDSLAKQIIVRGDESLASTLADSGELSEYANGSEIIEDGSPDNDLYFILAGSVDIKVNQRIVARRTAGQHVGEIAMIDPSSARCASVVASDTVVTLAISESSFTRTATKVPELWRRLALELATRLRQGNDSVEPPNARPHLFIGSSTEALDVARAIQLGLRLDSITIQTWMDGVFGVASFVIEDLEKQVKMADFGLLVLGPDDELVSRGKLENAPRDNVIFELGMCLGTLSRRRTFFAFPRGADLKIPTDLLGLTALEYEYMEGENLDAALAPVCERLRRAINELGVK